jgi:hypothetical protein
MGCWVRLWARRMMVVAVLLYGPGKVKRMRSPCFSYAVTGATLVAGPPPPKLNASTPLSRLSNPPAPPPFCEIIGTPPLIIPLPPKPSRRLKEGAMVGKEAGGAAFRLLPRFRPRISSSELRLLLVDVVGMVLVEAELSPPRSRSSRSSRGFLSCFTAARPLRTCGRAALVKKQMFKKRMHRTFIGHQFNVRLMLRIRENFNLSYEVILPELITD